MILLSVWPIHQPPLVYDHTQACHIARPMAVTIASVRSVFGDDFVPFTALWPSAHTILPHDNLIHPCREVLLPPLAGAESVEPVSWCHGQGTGAPRPGAWDRGARLA